MASLDLTPMVRVEEMKDNVIFRSEQIIKEGF